MDNAVNLFQRLNSKLFELLSGLSSEQWNKNISSGNAKVQDIAIQLLDESRQNLFHFFDVSDLNDIHINSFKDFNPETYLSDLQIIQKQLDPYFNKIPTFSGLDKNNTLDVVAIDLLKVYAKNWLYQQQIRQAVGASLLLEADFYHSFLEYCMRFLPKHFENIIPANDTIISIEIVAETNMTWQIIRREQSWDFTESQAHSATQVYIDQNIAWILFSGGIDIYEASQYWQVIGNQDLGRHVLGLRSFDE
jgi:hypothetical protein